MVEGGQKMARELSLGAVLPTGLCAAIALLGASVILILLVSV